MNNILFKDIDIEEELPVRRSSQYSPIRLNTYKVTVINTNNLLATNTDKQSYPSNLDLVDYINKIYMQTTRKSNISGEYSVGYVSYDGNYLTIVENSSNINSLIHKTVFDVRDIKLPKTTLQQLDELQKYSNYSFKENSFNNADVCRFLTYPYNKTKGMELYNRILFKKNKYLMECWGQKVVV